MGSIVISLYDRVELFVVDTSGRTQGARNETRPARKATMYDSSAIHRSPIASIIGRMNSTAGRLPGLVLLDFDQLHRFAVTDKFAAPGFTHENNGSADITPVDFPGLLDIHHSGSLPATRRGRLSLIPEERKDDCYRFRQFPKSGICMLLPGKKRSCMPRLRGCMPDLHYL